MNERGSFYRKVAYLIVVAVLMLPISRLGAPSTRKDDGGALAQLRAEYDLGQADLGEIDPASETIRFATLGMRGIAVSLLWNKANQYKKTEDWTNFRATLRQLAKLQPYFISFWKYQAWNLTYNVSVELDDVQDRYHYVKKELSSSRRELATTVTIPTCWRSWVGLLVIKLVVRMNTSSTGACSKQTTSFIRKTVNLRIVTIG
jgi:hypothetical protein